jgi:hypothetical protein
MMNSTAGWLIGIAAFGMMAAALGNEVMGLNTWAAIMTPAFVGKALVHLGAVIGAFVGGKMIPTEGE